MGGKDWMPTRSLDDWQHVLLRQGFHRSNFARRTEVEDRAWHSTLRAYPAGILFLKV
jgi:hypothetical protein